MDLLFSAIRMNLSQIILVFVKHNILFEVLVQKFVYNEDNYTIGEVVADPMQEDFL